VFGYRASKIRQGKLSGLIHNSESHQNLDHCSVSVFFQMIVDKVSRGVVRWLQLLWATACSPPQTRGKPRLPRLPNRGLFGAPVCCVDHAQ